MSQLFSFKDMDYDLQGDNVRTVNYGTETILYLAPKIWEQVPDDIKDCLSLEVFKCKIKLWIPSSCPCKICKIYIPEVDNMMRVRTPTPTKHTHPNTPKHTHPHPHPHSHPPTPTHPHTQTHPPKPTPTHPHPHKTHSHIQICYPVFYIFGLLSKFLYLFVEIFNLGQF